MQVKSGFWDPESKKRPSRMNRCPFNRGNKYKSYVNFFRGPNFVSPEWRCLLNRDAPKDRFHCIYIINSVNYANGLFKVYTKHCSPFLFYF